MTMDHRLPSPARGYTLMELMIVMVIIGVLAAIAVPSYGSYVLRANRTVGKTLVMRIAGQQEGYFTDRKQYATALNTLATDYSAATMYLKRDGRVQASNTSDTIYSVVLGAYSAATVASCTVTGSPSATQYAIKITPINAQAKDTTCGSLCYGSPGDRGKSGSSADCWTR